MQMNFIAIAIAALVPLIMGFIWYNPKTLGTIWMKESGVTEETMKGANMALIFGLCYVFSLMISLGLYSMVIHQSHIYSILLGQPGFMEEGSELTNWYNSFMEQHGQNYRTFKHGALHGFIGGLFLAFPLMAINAMFERKSFKYIFLNAGYWAIVMSLMGGIICQWG